MNSFKRLLSSTITLVLSFLRSTTNYIADGISERNMKKVALNLVLLLSVATLVILTAALNLYPPAFNLYRSSRGIKRPEVWQTTERESQAKISGIPLTYEKTISITDEGGSIRNIINYRTYTKGADTSRPKTEEQDGEEAGTTAGTPI